MKDGTPFNPAPMCQVPRCVNKSSARLVELAENGKRRDLCYGHALTTYKHYSEHLDVAAVWNELDWDDFDD